MDFLDRTPELARLLALARRPGGGLAVVVGRRRIGKTRLLLEWARRTGGLYVVVDESAPHVQRAYVAQAVAERIPGFADVAYPSWDALLTRLAQEATRLGWRGPVVFDELPYLVASSPELPSVLQRFVDHAAADAGLVLALAGSSQRMMQGLVLSADAPLYGRAHEVLSLQPIGATYLGEALGVRPGAGLVEAWTAWGGVPRYWELAAALRGTTADRLDRLVLDPLGPLHAEPDRWLREESPTAQEVRPVLDAIGAGAHRVSEIAGRLGRPATSLARPLARLAELGLVRRDVPFAESARVARRALYVIDDPFFRLWFRVVAPHRALLTSGAPATRREVLERHWSGLVSAAWEDLCRACLPSLRGRAARVLGGPFEPGSRWWRGGANEWDVVARSSDGHSLLLGEAKFSARPMSARDVASAAASLLAKPEPALPSHLSAMTRVRVLLVPEVAAGARPPAGCHVVTATDLF